MTLLTDTLAARNLLVENGFEEKKAEAIVKVMTSQEESVATKADIDSLRKDTKQDIALLRSELKNEISALKTQMAELKNQLWSIGAILIGVMAALKFIPFG